jgi:hypothetical protein
MLPVQYRETVRSSSGPELRLMAEVMRRAISDFRHYWTDQRPLGRRLFHLASEWIASRESHVA